MKKLSPLKLIIITAVIVAIIAAAITATVCYFALREVNPCVGDTVTEETVVNATTTLEGSEDEETIKHTYVYLGASSKLYSDHEDNISVGIFLDIFSDTDLAELIDTDGFPYKMEYKAVTSSANNTRYEIKTDSGLTYWVEP